MKKKLKLTGESIVIIHLPVVERVVSWLPFYKVNKWVSLSIDFDKKGLIKIYVGGKLIKSGVELKKNLNKE